MTTRTATDTLGTSDAATRTIAVSRTATDTLGTSELGTWTPFSPDAEVPFPVEIERTPFDLIGMTYMNVRCERCRGTGRQTRLVV